MDYKSELIGLYDELKGNPLIQLDTYSIGGIKKSKSMTQLRSKIEDPSLSEFYGTTGFFNIKWHEKRTKDSGFSGSINILEGNESLASGEGLIYHKSTPEDSPLRKFKILDVFADEACVGFFFGENTPKGLHYFEFESETYPLLINFEGYAKLLTKSRGFFYWQKVLVEDNEGDAGPVTEHFREQMPRLFPEFDFKDFIESYKSYKIIG
jgi:hypothetical protein